MYSEISQGGLFSNSSNAWLLLNAIPDSWRAWRARANRFSLTRVLLFFQFSVYVARANIGRTCTINPPEGPYLAGLDLTERKKPCSEPSHVQLSY